MSFPTSVEVESVFEFDAVASFPRMKQDGRFLILASPLVWLVATLEMCFGLLR
jgi:hypothetical protein